MAVQHGLFGVVPVLAMVLAVAFVASHHAIAIDFRRQYWVAGHRLLHGLSPFDPSWQHLHQGIGFPYSAFDAMLFAPFGLIPQHVAAVLFAAIDLGAVLLTIRLLGVRDWRVYGVVVLWAPVFSAWQTGNVTALLGLGIAVMWRRRDNPVVAGGMMALLVTVKLFVWPLGLWLLATRRYAHIGWGIAIGVVLNVGSWAVIGFGEISRYRDLISKVAHMDESRAYSILALSLHNGASRPVAYALGMFVAAAVAATAIWLGRRGQDQAAFILCLTAALLAAPVIWLHYFALLVIPLALTRPSFHPLWLVPWVTLVCPVTDAVTWEILLVLTVVAIVIVTSVRASLPAGVPGSNAPSEAAVGV